MKAFRLMLFGFGVAALAVCVWWYFAPGEEVEPAGMQTLSAKKEMAQSTARVETHSKATANAAPVVRAEAREAAVITEVGKNADGSLTAILAQVNRFERQQALERLGYGAARESAAMAAQRLLEITAPADRAAFLRGMFAQLGERGMAEALGAFKELRSRRDREAALGALVETWEKEDVSPGDSVEFGYETLEGRLLAKLVGDPARMVEAARELARGNDRLQLLKLAATAETWRDPQRALEFGKDLQGEELSGFLQTVALEWGRHRGEPALTWALQETDPELRARLQTEAIEGWGLSQPEAAARRLGDIADPALRQEARQTIASQWGMTDTQAALQWANGLSDPEARAHAVAAIQTSAPVGIGVALTSSPEGLPMVRDLIPGSPASTGGQLKPGYQIAAIGDGRGGFTKLNGVTLEEVTKLIRGRPGTSAVLQVIPPGGTAANPWTVTVPRRQLMFKTPPAAPAVP